MLIRSTRLFSLPALIKNAVRVYFLLEQGRVFTWGSGCDGRLGLGDDFSDVLLPRIVEGLLHEQIMRVECGYNFTLFLDGTFLLMCIRTGLPRHCCSVVTRSFCKKLLGKVGSVAVYL